MPKIIFPRIKSRYNVGSNPPHKKSTIADKTKVSLLIRAFQNTDSQALCRVFNSHYEAVGLPSIIGPLSLELCVLAKPYFETQLLLVAEWAGQVVGFSLLGMEPDESLQSLNSFRAVMSSLCVSGQLPADCIEDEVAQPLIAESLTALVQWGAVEVRYCPPPPASPFFAGFTPGDGLIGAPLIDPRVRKWLAEAGWTVESRWDCWENDLSRFKSPMDRMQIQIRRMAYVDRLLDEPLLPWYVASMLGHTEPIGFQLTNRESRSVTAKVVLWTIGHELLPQPEMIAHLWPLSAVECCHNEDQLVFLLSEAFRQLREDHIDVVRTIAPTADADIGRLLRRIGFEPAVSGEVFYTKL